MHISDGKVVLVDFVMTNREGKILNRTADQAPLAYLHGAGEILRNLESPLVGRSIGETLTIRLEPEDAYGYRNDELLWNFPGNHFQSIDDLQIGDIVEVEFPHGQQLATIINIESDEVTVDGNHPLADEYLIYDIEIVGIREPTAGEIKHGHAHDA